MGRWLGEADALMQANYHERELLRQFLRAGRPLTPANVSQLMGVENKTIRKWLRQLSEKRWIQPVSGSVRIRSYRLSLDAERLLL